MPTVTALSLRSGFKKKAILDQTRLGVTQIVQSSKAFTLENATAAAIKEKQHKS